MFVIKIDKIRPVIPALEGARFLTFDSQEDAVEFINKHWDYYANRYIHESGSYKQVYDHFIKQLPEGSTIGETKRD